MNKIHGNIYPQTKFISETTKVRNLPWLVPTGRKKPNPPVPGLESGAAVGEVDITLSCIPNQPHVAAAVWWWEMVGYLESRWEMVVLSQASLF